MHVGPPKTGTTTLQLQLFARHGEIAFLGLFGHFHKDLRIESLVQAIRAEPDESFDAAACGRLYNEAVAPALGGGKAVVLSDERLTSRTRREGSRIETLVAVDQDLVATRLRRLFQGWRILLTVRAKPALLWSWYLHDCRNAILRPDDWLAEHLGRGDAGRLSGLKYFTMAERYARLFGRENLIILPFEELVADRARYAQKIAGALGVDAKEAVGLLTERPENVRVSWRMMAYQRLRHVVAPNVDLHRYIPAPLRRAAYDLLRRGRPTEARMPEHWRAPTAAFFRADNRRFAEAWGLDLPRLGYPL